MTWGYKIDGQSKPEVYSSELGKKYNAITIVDYVGFCIKSHCTSGGKRVTKMQIFKCKCDCGEETYEWIEDIKSGKVQKCKKCGKNCTMADSKAKTTAVANKADNKVKMTTVANKAEKENQGGTNEVEQNITNTTISRTTDNDANDFLVVCDDYSKYEKYTNGTGISNSLKKYIGKKFGHIKIVDYAYTLVSKGEGAKRYLIMYRGICDCGAKCIVSFNEILTGKKLICSACAASKGLSQSDVTEPITEPATKPATKATTKPTTKAAVEPAAKPATKPEASVNNDTINSSEASKTAAQETGTKYTVKLIDTLNAYKEYSQYKGKRFGNIVVLDVITKGSFYYMLVQCDCGDKFVITDRAFMYLKSNPGEYVVFSHAGCGLDMSQYKKNQIIYLRYYNETNGKAKCTDFSFLDKVNTVDKTKQSVISDTAESKAEQSKAKQSQKSPGVADFEELMAQLKDADDAKVQMELITKIVQISKSRVFNILNQYNLFDKAGKGKSPMEMTGVRLGNIVIKDVKIVNGYTCFLLRCDCGEEFIASIEQFKNIWWNSKTREVLLFKHAGCKLKYLNNVCDSGLSTYISYFGEHVGFGKFRTFQGVEEFFGEETVEELLDEVKQNEPVAKEQVRRNRFVAVPATKMNTEVIKKRMAYKTNVDMGGTTIMNNVEKYIVRNADGKINLDATFNRCVGAVIATSTAKTDSYSVAEYTVNNFEVKIKNNVVGRFVKQFMDIVRGYELTPALRDDMLSLLIKHYLHVE